MRALGEDLETIAGDNAEILEPHAKLTGEVNSRLYRYDVAFDERFVVSQVQHGQLVHVDSHSMPKAVTHSSLEPAIGEYALGEFMG
jgi:hypothetical protein